MGGPAEGRRGGEAREGGEGGGGERAELSLRSRPNRRRRGGGGGGLSYFMVHCNAVFCVSCAVSRFILGNALSCFVNQELDERNCFFVGGIVLIVQKGKGFFED